MNSPLLELQDVATQVNSNGKALSVLRGVSFSIARGEAVGLVGESGSGKSMTARTIMQLMPAGAHATGSVFLDGVDILKLTGKALRRARARRLAMIFQDPRASVNPVRTCGSQLAEVLQVHLKLPRREAQKRAAGLLEDVGLHDPHRVMRANPSELSGGMLQRLMIAIALAGEPDVLIADEATTALDVTIQAEIVALLDELRRSRGLALLFITHDLELASMLCQRLLVMYAGRIVEAQDTVSLFKSPAHPYTSALLAARPSLDHRVGRLAAIPGRPPAFDELPPGCPFAPRCPHKRPRCVDTPPSLRRLDDGSQTTCVRSEQLRGGLRGVERSSAIQ